MRGQNTAGTRVEMKIPGGGQQLCHGEGHMPFDEHAFFPFKDVLALRQRRNCMIHAINHVVSQWYVVTMGVCRNFVQFQKKLLNTFSLSYCKLFNNINGQHLLLFARHNFKHFAYVNIRNIHKKSMRLEQVLRLPLYIGEGIEAGNQCYRLTSSETDIETEFRLQNVLLGINISEKEEEEEADTKTK